MIVECNSCVLMRMKRLVLRICVLEVILESVGGGLRFARRSGLGFVSVSLAVCWRSVGEGCSG